MIGEVEDEQWCVGDLGMPSHRGGQSIVEHDPPFSLRVGPRPAWFVPGQPAAEVECVGEEAGLSAVRLQGGRLELTMRGELSRVEREQVARAVDAGDHIERAGTAARAAGQAELVAR